MFLLVVICSKNLQDLPLLNHFLITTYFVIIYFQYYDIISSNEHELPYQIFNKRSKHKLQGF